jgi:hypothetical protein
MKVKSFNLIGNQPVSRECGGRQDGDYLSDHFGLAVQIDVDNNKLDE